MGERRFRFGVVGEDLRTAEQLTAEARRLEALGFSTLLLRDHFVTEPFGEQFAPMVGLMAAAAATTSLRVGTLVIDNDYRHPVLLAKEAASLDVLSGGRFELGLGAGWLRDEYERAGLPFDSAGVRIDRLEESLQILKCLLSGSPATIQGKHYTVDRLTTFPRPVQRPHPPILIGGGGERKTLRLVARYADACNVSASSPEDVAHKLDVLRSHCQAEGRDYESIFKTVLAYRPVLADVDEWLAAAGEYAKLGVGEIAIMPEPGRSPVEWVEEVADRVMPRVLEIG